MATEENELEELDESLPCSVVNNKKVHLLFLNKTLRDVYVIWLDFSGKRVIYAVLNPNHILPMYTFERHPWIFEDARTGDRMLCDGQEVFIPTRDDDANNEITGVMITTPCYSLRRYAINNIRDNIRDVDTIDPSQVPDSVLSDIRRAIDLKQRMLNTYEHCSRA